MALYVSAQIVNQYRRRLRITANEQHDAWQLGKRLTRRTIMTIERFKTHMPAAETIVEHETECILTYALRDCLLGLFINFEDSLLPSYFSAADLSLPSLPTPALLTNTPTPTHRALPCNFEPPLSPSISVSLPPYPFPLSPCLLFSLSSTSLSLPLSPLSKTVRAKL